MAGRDRTVVRDVFTTIKRYFVRWHPAVSDVVMPSIPKRLFRINLTGDALEFV